MTPALVQKVKFINTFKRNSDLLRTILCENQALHVWLGDVSLTGTGTGRLALIAALSLAALSLYNPMIAGVFFAIVGAGIGYYWFFVRGNINDDWATRDV